MIKLILVPGLLCTKRLFETQISALKYDYEIEVANTLGVNTIHEMAQEIISKQNSILSQNNTQKKTKNKNNPS